PTSDHKMVQQLDDVTKDSEEKATQMFDQLDLINNFLVDIENVANDNKVVVESNIELFNKLCDKFPNVETFKEALDKNKKLLDEISDIMTKIQDGQNEIMNTMDMMQYQDIHRQKIERVINVMRALSKYMNSLFESSIDDKSRAPSAVHIQGDTSTESVMSDDDIEALINSLGKK
nr:chemotaxis protein [Campylobacter sp.]